MAILSTLARVPVLGNANNSHRGVTKVLYFNQIPQLPSLQILLPGYQQFSPNTKSPHPLSSSSGIPSAECSTAIIFTCIHYISISLTSSRVAPSVILPFTSSCAPKLDSAPVGSHGKLKGQTPVDLGYILPNNHTWLPGPLPLNPPWLFWQLGHWQRWAELSSWLLWALWCHFPWLTLGYGEWSPLHFQITWYAHERLWGRLYFKCYPCLCLPDTEM